MSAKSRGSTIPASVHSTTSYKSCCEFRAKDPSSKNCGCGPDEPPKSELKRFDNRYIQDRDIGRKNVWNYYNSDWPWVYFQHISRYSETQKGVFISHCFQHLLRMFFQFQTY